VKQRSRCNPSGTKAKQLCLEEATGRLPYEIGGEKVKHRAERRAQNETFAPVPSFLQGYTSIDRVSSGFLVARIIRARFIRARQIAHLVSDF